MNDMERERLKHELTRLFNRSRGAGGAKEIYTFQLYTVWFQHAPREAITDAYINTRHHMNDFEEYTLDDLLNLEELSKKLTFFDPKIFVDMNAVDVAVDKFIDRMNTLKIAVNKTCKNVYKEKLIYNVEQSIKFNNESVLNTITSLYVFKAHDKMLADIEKLLTDICAVIDKSNDFGERETCDVRERDKRDKAITNYRRLLTGIISNNKEMYDLFKDYNYNFMWESLMLYIWGGLHLKNETDIKTGIARAVKVSIFNKKENDKNE